MDEGHAVARSAVPNESADAAPWSEHFTLLRSRGFMVVAAIFLVIWALAVVVDDEPTINGRPYHGPRWIYWAMGPAVLAAYAVLGGTRVKVDERGLLLRQGLLWRRRVPRKSIVSVELMPGETSRWHSPFFFRVNGWLPIGGDAARDFRHAGTHTVRVRTNERKAFLVATSDPGRLQSAFLTETGRMQDEESGS